MKISKSFLKLFGIINNGNDNFQTKLLICPISLKKNFQMQFLWQFRTFKWYDLYNLRQFFLIEYTCKLIATLHSIYNFRNEY